jgi:hypothetical protein
LAKIIRLNLQIILGRLRTSDEREIFNIRHGAETRWKVVPAFPDLALNGIFKKIVTGFLLGNGIEKREMLILSGSICIGCTRCKVWTAFPRRLNNIDVK